MKLFNFAQCISVYAVWAYDVISNSTIANSIYRNLQEFTGIMYNRVGDNTLVSQVARSFISGC